MSFSDDVKVYCRTDEDVTDFVEAAECYLEGAGIEKDETNMLYGLAVKMLVTHWYDNRELVGKVDKIAFGLDGIILQLQNQVT